MLSEYAVDEEFQKWCAGRAEPALHTIFSVYHYRRVSPIWMGPHR